MTCNNCNNNITAGIAPGQAIVNKEVTENHTVVFSNSAYAAGIEVVNDFNIPAIGEDISVEIRGAYNIPVGAYFYHAAYGYLKIGNWNCNTNTVGLLNENIRGTAAPGTFVPACTMFIVAAKPCCEDTTSILFPFVREDFIAPSVGVNTVVEVTSVFGLEVGELIRIGNGLYELVNINSSNQIVIVNNGAGITPGTLVEALGPDGEYQYLITRESVSPCSSPTVTEGRLLVCDGADQSILGGNFVGQVPILRDETTEEVSFGLLDAEERTCTVLTANLNVTAADPTYTISVNSTTGFIVGDILQINSGSLRFEITAIGTGTFDVTTIPNPPAVNLNISTGALVCKALTVELLQEQIDVINTDITTIEGDITIIEGNITSINTSVTDLENRVQLIGTLLVSKDIGNFPLNIPWTNLSIGTTEITSLEALPSGMELVLQKAVVTRGHSSLINPATARIVIGSFGGIDFLDNTIALTPGMSITNEYNLTGVLTAYDGNLRALAIVTGVAPDVFTYRVYLYGYYRFV